MTLTEKWKKGELESGFYYVYLKHLEMFDIAGSSTLSGILERGNENSIEILAPVPTYNEYLESEAHCAVYSDINKWLKEENAKLKELLKECVGELQDFNNSSYPIVENLLIRINAAIGESEE